MHVNTWSLYIMSNCMDNVRIYTSGLGAGVKLPCLFSKHAASNSRQRIQVYSATMKRTTEALKQHQRLRTKAKV